MEVRSPISENTHVTLEWVHICTPATVEHMMCGGYTAPTVTYDMGADVTGVPCCEASECCILYVDLVIGTHPQW